MALFLLELKALSLLEQLAVGVGAEVGVGAVGCWCWSVGRCQCWSSGLLVLEWRSVLCWSCRCGQPREAEIVGAAYVCAVAVETNVL